jgi:hypothetical protein
MYTFPCFHLAMKVTSMTCTNNLCTHTQGLMLNDEDDINDLHTQKNKKIREV